MLSWTFSQQSEKSKKIPIDFYIFEILIIVNLSHMNILMFIIIYEYFGHWILLISFLYHTQSRYKYFQKPCYQIVKNVNMYLFLLTNLIIHLHYWIGLKI